MYGYDSVVARLPTPLREPLSRVSRAVSDRAQEIRLRVGAPLMLSLPEGDVPIGRDGRTLGGSSAAAVICVRELLEETFAVLCDRALYAHQEEIVCGYITAQGGVRVGLAGSAVTEGGRVTALRDITSLCIRIPRCHNGCADVLCKEICKGESLHSVLLVGAPATGKTSMLRDAARRFAGQHRRVAVADERGELALGGGLIGCDVLSGLPKATAALQAVRCLAPDMLFFDELGDVAEVRALVQALNSGVCVVGSVHAADEVQLARRPAAVLALQSGVFDTILFLAGRHRVGQVVRVMEAREWEGIRGGQNGGSVVGSGGLYGTWAEYESLAATAGTGTGGLRALAAAP